MSRRRASRNCSSPVNAVAESMSALPMRRTKGCSLGGPDDIADVVALLASDAARWITGQVIDASGGLFLGPRV
ncbi:NAD(P)-dependent dehydrogenase (short-subunit alcohol dehydrogenase family) [Kibdelosporangium banguiense]|uniref:NAD(P)-dependent dehydrogenase (Short-subunit alcohol dehydrogenase family) n=1 Tax=Kibdelosporangium banguiense TaxID=1365924 RepID=A0ABS4TTG6_9PSEU|nr:NAD(P)-dependent dehydrogenase (short-subunit alcohol dehydrogenase family) [Kibdelosporangium banguiense]